MRGSNTNRHHLLFTHSAWNSGEHTAGLRGHYALIPRIDREAHAALHREITTVPLIDHYLGSRALRYFEPGHTTLESIDNLMFAIQKGLTHPQTRQIDREVAHLTLRAIELEKPYVDLGITNARVIDLAAA